MKNIDFINGDLHVGQKVSGIVKNITKYGAFVDIQGIIQGLLHISEMTWERDKKPKDILKVGQEITAKVVDFKKDEKKIC